MYAVSVQIDYISCTVPDINDKGTNIEYRFCDCKPSGSFQSFPYAAVTSSRKHVLYRKNELALLIQDSLSWRCAHGITLLHIITFKGEDQ